MDGFHLSLVFAIPVGYAAHVLDAPVSDTDGAQILDDLFISARDGIVVRRRQFPEKKRSFLILPS